MKLTKKLAALLLAAAAGLLGLSACTDDSGPDTPGTTTQPEKGFAADSVIGVSLPWLGTTNWAEASKLLDSELAAAGFKPTVLQADQKIEVQQQQIESLIEAGAKVIVVGPEDGKSLGTVLEKAKAEGIFILGYDRLLENTNAVDGVVQYGSVDTGREQAKALLAGLAAWKGDGPYNIELFGGGPADPNAPNFFKGAMEILQPKIDDGTLVVVSGQTTFQDCATEAWSADKAQERMDSLLATFYSDKDIDGALSPNDSIARAIITAVQNSGNTDPFPTSGLDSDVLSIEWIAAGTQYSTVDKPAKDLVAKTLELIKILQSGKDLPAGTGTAKNGVIDVQLFELPPVAVTKDNACTVFANDAERFAAAQC
ncbi:MAG: sugar-binding protein [Propionibacteriaceae bacterium]|jgi:putative multiple sugar transport system substrate-binding protein|nr:sugar-binding protein [Propionibacteriaceae bacterium]